MFSQHMEQDVFINVHQDLLTHSGSHGIQSMLVNRGLRRNTAVGVGHSNGIYVDKCALDAVLKIDP